MAGKRKHDDWTGSVATPKKKKRKRPAHHEEEEPQVKPNAKRGGEKELPRGGESTATPAEIREAEFEKEKRKKSGKKRGGGKEGLDNLDPTPVSDAEPHRKKKKKQDEEDTHLLPRLDDLQSSEDRGLVSSAEPQRKKKKKKKEGIPKTSTLLTSQIVEDHGLLSGAEPQKKKKKKKKKTKEVTPMPVTLDSSQIVEDSQRKNKTKKEVTPTPVTLDSSQIIEDGQRKKKKKTKKEVAPTPLSLDSSQVVEDGQRKKKTMKEATPTPVSLNSSQIVEDCQGKKKKKTKEATPTPLTLDSSQIVEDGLGSGAESHGKKKKGTFTTMLHSSDPSHAVKDSGPITGSVKKTILKSQKPKAGNGAESDRKKKKKVTFQLPDRVEDEPSEKGVLGEEAEFTDLESSNWKTDKLRPGLVYGMYTPEEDGVLKEAIFDYIQEQGWDREEGLEKILNSRRSEARGCWHVIRKCLPQRELKRLYARAHRILGPNTLLGKWTNEEMQSLTELHSVHGNDWKRIATIIGRDPEACKDKWRYLKFSTSKDYKIGAWSEEEQQKLCKLVLKCLHVKAQMAQKGLIIKGHRMIRDDINWEFIAEQMGGRGRLDCLSQWYRRMASPMVTTGEWSNGDDQRLLERLMEEFPLSEELVEWDSLLNNRSGEKCKKRWEQMQRSLGRGPEVRHQHFLEKLESVMKRFAPHLLDTEYDQKFAEDMERADAEEPEDEEDVDM